VKTEVDGVLKVERMVRESIGGDFWVADFLSGELGQRERYTGLAEQSFRSFHVTASIIFFTPMRLITR